MSDVEKYIHKRKARNPRAWANFDDKYREYAVGALLAEHRRKAGLTISALAQRMKMQKSSLSRIEHHGMNVRLSTISSYVEATGQPMIIKFSPAASNSGRGSKNSVSIEVVSA